MPGCPSVKSPAGWAAGHWSARPSGAMGEPALLSSAAPFQPGAAVGCGGSHAYSRLPRKDLLGDCFLRLRGHHTFFGLNQKPVFPHSEKKLVTCPAARGAL